MSIASELTNRVRQEIQKSLNTGFIDPNMIRSYPYANKFSFHSRLQRILMDAAPRSLYALQEVRFLAAKPFLRNGKSRGQLTFQFDVGFYQQPDCKDPVALGEVFTMDGVHDSRWRDRVMHTVQDTKFSARLIIILFVLPKDPSAILQAPSWWGKGWNKKGPAEKKKIIAGFEKDFEEFSADLRKSIGAGKCSVIRVIESGTEVL